MIWEDKTHEDTHRPNRPPDYDVYYLHTGDDFNSHVAAVIYDHNERYQISYEAPRWAYLLFDDPYSEEEPFLDHIQTLEDRKIFVETLVRLL